MNVNNNVKDKEIGKNTKINEKIKRKKVYVLLEHIIRYLRKRKKKKKKETKNSSRKEPIYNNRITWPLKCYIKNTLSFFTSKKKKKKKKKRKNKKTYPI